VNLFLPGYDGNQAGKVKVEIVMVY